MLIGGPFRSSAMAGMKTSVACFPKENTAACQVQSPKSKLSDADPEPAPSTCSAHILPTRTLTTATTGNGQSDLEELLASFKPDVSMANLIITTTTSSSGTGMTSSTVSNPATTSTSADSSSLASVTTLRSTTVASQGHSGSGGDSSPSSVWIGSVTASVTAFLILIALIICTFDL